MILMYHKVFPESPTTWWVDVDNFYRQMCELKCKKVVYLDEYDINDKNQVVVTFDGVYKNVLEYSAPILKHFGYPFELFVTSDYIGKDNSFDASEPQAVFAFTEDLKELVESGGRLQWHSRTHQNLKYIKDLEKIQYEMSIPEELRLLDKEGFKWFAYPHGDFNETVIEETKKSFKGGISCIQGDDHDPFKLNRIPVTNESSFKKGSIAVIIASYNYGSFLVEAIESVLRQTRPVDQILIADDCSTDNTMEIALEYQKGFPNLIKYMRNEENMGIVRNFNKAVSNTTSDYICFLGADNRFRSDYIEKTTEILDSNDSIGIAYTDFALFGARAKLVYDGFSSDRKGDIKQGYYYIIKFPDFNKESRRELLEVGNFIHGSSMYKRKAFHDAGGYKEEKYQPEDYNLFLRMIRKGWAAKRVPDPILEYRQHSKNQTNINLKSFIELIHYKEQVKRLQDAVREKEAYIQFIHSGRGWKLLTKYYKVRDRLLHKSKRGMAIAKSLRRLLYFITKENIKKSLLYIKIFGVQAFYSKVREKIGITIPYDVWIKKNEPKRDELGRQRDTRFAYEPKVSIIVPTYDTREDFLIAMIESVLNQSYPNWELCIADGGTREPHVKKILESYAKKDKRIKLKFLIENKGIAGNSNEAISLATGEFVALLDHDDILPPFALFEVIKNINEHPDIEFIYSDRDKISDDRRFDPFFKPDWSPDYLLSQNYLCHLTIFKKALIDKIGWFRDGFDGSQDYDLFLRITEVTDKIMHIPKILYHWRVTESSASGNPEAKPYAYAAAIRALQDAVKRRGWKGTVTQGKVKGLYRVIFELIGTPKVSIIIPSKDNSEVLKKCIDSILKKSTYKNYEIAIVDNQSREKKTFEYYIELKKNPKIRLLSYERSFNFSEINNYAVSKLNAEYVLFLNNDMEVITENWIELMLGFAQRKETGAVGAKLIYPDETIQTAGLILDKNGNVRRSHYRYPSNSLGYAGRILSIQNVSSVAAACMMVRREVFDEVGGFDPQFVVAHGDIDFCLKLREKNYLIVYEPHVELYHYESLTRGYEDTPEKIERLNRETRLLLKKRSRILEKGDPYFNPNLTADKEDFSIRA